MAGLTLQQLNSIDFPDRTAHANPMLTFVVGSVLTFLHLFLILYCTSGWTLRLLPNQPLHIRLTATSIATWWLAGLIFALLIPLGLFNTTAVTILLALLTMFTAVRVQGPSAIIRFYTDLFSAGKFLWKGLPLWIRIATAGVLLVLIVRLGRGIIAPPLAWDALTYHLLKAGRWVQSGGWVFDNAPDSWQFYEWFPPLGDVYFAWAMLATHTDAWLAWLGAATWVNCAFAVYALARAFQFDQKLSWLAAITAAAAPASLAFITANYVDNTALAIVTLGSVLLISGSRQKAPRQLAIATVAMGLAVGIKITFLPYVLVALTLLLWHSLAQRRLKILLPTLLALLPCLSWQAWLIANGHTPFYPAPFSIMGFQVEAGQPEFIKHHYSNLDFAYAYELPASIMKFLRNSPSFSPGHYNFTFMFPVVLLLGLLGCYQGLKISPSSVRIALAGMLMAGLAIFASFWLPQTSYYRAVWVENLGRFFSAWYAPLVVGLLFLWNPVWRYLFGAVIAVSLFEAWPKAWTSLDYQCVGIGLMLLMGIAVLAMLLRKQTALRFRSGLAGAVCCIMLLGIYHFRSTYRYVIYSNEHSYDVYYPKSVPSFIDAARFTDEKSDQTIAFSIAHEDIAYRWFRYVFLGSRLQKYCCVYPNNRQRKSMEPRRNADTTTPQPG